MTDAEQSSWTTQVDRMTPEDLRALAASMPVIEQAKGILMGHYGCDAGTAFVILQRWSSLRSVKLRDLAAALVAEASVDDPSPAVERLLRAYDLG